MLYENNKQGKEKRKRGEMLIGGSRKQPWESRAPFSHLETSKLQREFRRRYPTHSCYRALVCWKQPRTVESHQTLHTGLKRPSLTFRV